MTQKPTSDEVRYVPDSGLKAPSKYDVQRVGERLRTLRVAKGLTVSKLAALAQVPPSTISKMENGRLKPSLVHAINLATALGENLGFLVDRYRDAREDVVIVTRNERAVIEYPEMGLKLEDLSRNFYSGILEARAGEIAKGATSGDETMVHAGEEFCHVLSGRLRYIIEDEIIDLAAGDSVHFKSSIRHRWENLQDGVTRVLWVFSDDLAF